MLEITGLASMLEITGLAATTAGFHSCFHPTNRHKRKATFTATNPEGRWRKLLIKSL
ncbi:MAG: hypothetical protein WKF89_06315 [Chitinophagaceae bacterium]